MKTIASILACAALAVALGACQQRLTSENLAKVTKGMSMEEAERILGKPTSVETTELPLLSTTRYGYESGDDRVTLVFVNDKLISKSGSIGVNSNTSDQSE